MRTLLALSLLLLPSRVQAEPITETRGAAIRIELAAAGSYAGELQPSTRGDLGLYRYGYGLRGGVAFGAFSATAMVTRFVGTTERASGVGSSYDAHYDATLLGLDLGWTFRVHPRMFLRPTLGGGLRRVAGHTTVQATTLDDASSSFFLDVAVLYGVRLGPAFVGPELRLVAAPLNLPGGWAPTGSLVAGVVF